jgi:hypothetical protein
MVEASSVNSRSGWLTDLQRLPKYLRIIKMKRGAVWYKDSWLMPGSRALELYKEWEKETDPKLKQEAQKKLIAHNNELNLKEKLLLK